MIAVNDQTGEQWGLPLNLELFVACALGSAFEFGIIRIQSKKRPISQKLTEAAVIHLPHSKGKAYCIPGKALITSDII